MGADVLQVGRLLQRLVMGMLDWHHAGQQGVAQHGAQSHQSRQELLPPLVGNVVEVSAFRLGGSLLTEALWTKKQQQQQQRGECQPCFYCVSTLGSWCSLTVALLTAAWNTTSQLLLHFGAILAHHAHSDFFCLGWVGNTSVRTGLLPYQCRDSHRTHKEITAAETRIPVENFASRLPHFFLELWSCSSSREPGVPRAPV